MKRPHPYILALLVGIFSVSYALDARASRSSPISDFPRSYDRVLQFPVSGIVTDVDGEPLIGVNIVIQGTVQGTVTDEDGQFSLDLEDGQETLVFSYTGYQSLEVPVNGRSELSVVLEPIAEVLEEIVVIGYGAQRRKDVTGAISSIDGEEISKIPVSSFDVAIQGRAPGVIINPNSGQPGGAIDVNIRGIGTFGNNNPLYVIDGVPVFNNVNQLQGGIQTNPLSNLDPNNIESIEILKDASAAAIYGARAANGVVIITTRRGQEGDARIALNSYYGTQVFDNYIDMMDSRELAAMAIEANQNAGVDPPPAWSDPDVLQTNTDWQDEFFDPARIQDHNLTVSGGTARSSYLFSGGYFNQKGIAPNNNFERYAFRINTDFTIKVFDAIVHERRVELAFEYHRYNDLRRWGLAEEVLGPLGYIAPRNEYMPLPQAEVDTNPNLVQNPNW